MILSLLNVMKSTIRGRVLVSFTVVTLLLVFGSLGGYMAEKKNQKIQELVDLTHEQKGLIAQAASKSLEYVIQEGQKDVKEELVSVLHRIDGIFSSLSGVKEDAEGGRIRLTDHEESILTQVDSKYRILREKIGELLKIRREEVTVEDGDQLMLLGDILASKKAVEPELEKLINGLNDRADRANQRTLWIFFGATLFAAAISILAIFGTRRIVRRFNKMQKGLFRLRDADLTEKIEIEKRDELGEIGEITNSVMDHLSRIVSDVLSVSERLASTSEELSATCDHTVKGTDEQTNRITQVSTAMQEMSSTIVDMAKNASDSAEAAKETTRIARNGRERMDDLQKKMKGIETIVSKSSQAIHDLNKRVSEIVSIVGSINDIADQTNLLALNAAIEAARAGEQGRGFAVVADEVRKLAERTIKLTGEIAQSTQAMEQATGHVVQTMETEVREVKAGVEGARETGERLQEIGEKVEQISSMISQIAVATEEQSTVSEQISSDIETVAGITTENASGSKEIAVVSEDLARLAVGLQDQVRLFKIADGTLRRRQDTAGSPGPSPEGFLEEKVRYAS